jgi:hypothetical protein
VKVGDLVISRKEAEALGLTEDSENTFGKLAKVIKDGVAIASGKITRVLRGICFSGCGIVKNPANPGSIVLETANVKDKEADIVLDYDKINLKRVDNNVTSDKIEGQVSEIIEDPEFQKKNVIDDQDLPDLEHLKQDIKSIVSASLKTASLKKLIVKKNRIDKRNKLMAKLAAIIDEVGKKKH